MKVFITLTPTEHKQLGNAAELVEESPEEFVERAIRQRINIMRGGDEEYEYLRVRPSEEVI